MTNERADFFKTKTFLAVLFVFYFLLTLALYGSSLSNFYTADDFHNMFKVSEPGFLSSFSHLDFHFSPIPILFYKIIYSFLGFTPSAYRLLIFIINSMVCVLVYLLSLKMFILIDDEKKEEKFFIAKALICSIVFSFMNVHTETVISIACCLEMFFSFFFMLAFYFYLVYKQKKENIYLILSIVSFILSLLSKENALSFFILIFFFEKLIFRTGFIQIMKKYYSIITISIVYFLIRILLRNQMGEIIIRNIADYLSESIKNIIFTFTAFIFSLDFIRIKDIYKGDQINLINTFLDLIRLYPLAVILIITAFLFYILVWKKRKKIITFGFLFILITILPYMWLTGYERYFYLPSFGFVIIFSEYFVNLFYKKTIFKTIVTFITCTFIIYNIYFITVRKQNWKIASGVSFKTVNEIQQITSNLPINSLVYFRNLPDNYNGAWIYRDGVQYFPILFFHRPDMIFKKIYEEDVHSDLSKRIYVFNYNGEFVLEQ